VIAAADPLVPPGPARQLHAALAPLYAAAPERLRVVELQGETHWMSEEGWERARGEAEAWFRLFLGADEPRHAGA
jgi:hypothetical protein